MTAVCAPHETSRLVGLPEEEYVDDDGALALLEGSGKGNGSLTLSMFKRRRRLWAREEVSNFARFLDEGIWMIAGGDSSTSSSSTLRFRETADI